MANIQWILGVEPANLPSEWRATVKELFLQETGEVYADVSIASLPIPAWDGNLLLVDMDRYPDPSSFKGLMWALPFCKTGYGLQRLPFKQNTKGLAGVPSLGIILWAFAMRIKRTSSNWK